MIRNLTVLECMVGERAYRLTCENDSPLVDVKAALGEFTSHVVKIEESHEKARAAAEAEKEKLNDNQQ